MSTNHALQPTRRFGTARRLRRTAALLTVALVAAALALVGLGAAPASAANTVADGWITGTVTGPNGEAAQFREAPGVIAWDGDVAFARADDGNGYPTYGTKLGSGVIDPETGGFVINGLPAGRVKKLELSDNGGWTGYERRVFDVDLAIKPGDIVDAGAFELRKTGQIKLKVLNSDGLSLTEAPSSWDFAGIAAAALDDSGNAVGSSLYDGDDARANVMTFAVPPGHVSHLWFNFDSCGHYYYAFPKVKVDLQVESGGVVDAGEIRLPRSGALSGQVVTGPDGYRPVGYLARHVVAFDAGGNQWGALGRIEDDGRFSIAALPPGKITRLEVRAGDESVLKSFDVDVTINSKRTTDAGTFQVSDAGYLAGKIADPVFDTPDPEASVAVIAYDQNGGILGNNSDGYGMAYGADFYIPQMKPGRVKKLRFHDFGRGVKPPYADKSFDVDIEVLPGVVTSVAAPFVMSLNTAPTVVPSSVPRLAGPVRGVSGVVGSGRVGLSWVAPISDGGAPVTDFRVQYRPSAGGDWVSVDRPVSAATTASVTGLVNGSGYVFRVAAVTSAGVGAFSADSAVFTPALTAPAAPGAPTVTPGAGQVSLSWTAPADDGGSAVSDYRLRYRPAAGGDWVEVSDPVSAATSARISGLINGTGYVFQVAAVNSVGTGAWSAASAPVAPAGSPAAPTGVNGVAGDGQVTLSWTGPAADNGSPVTDYRVAFRSASGGAWVDFGEPVSAARAATVTGLANGTGYVFRVAAVNSVGQGAWSADSAAVIPVAPARAPGVVTGVGGVAGDGQVALSWTAPAGPVTDYRIWYRPASSSGGWWMVHEHTPSAAPSATIGGLANGTGYVFQVAAVNSVGQGAWSALSSPITPTASTPTPTAPVPPAQQPSDSSPVMVDQHVAGGVPVRLKRNTRKRIRLPRGTDGGQGVAWSAATPKICKVVRGRLKLTGKRGVCRIIGSAPGTAQRNALRQAYAIRVR